MFSKIKGMFSSCRSNHYVAVSAPAPIIVKNKSENKQVNHVATPDPVSVTVTNESKNKQVTIEIPKSIFDFQAPNSHRAVILDNQDLFKSLQTDVIKIIDDYMKDIKDTPEHKSIKENLHKKRQIYVIDDFTETDSQTETVMIFFKVLLSN
jgi:hypothetical protein